MLTMQPVDNRCQERCAYQQIVIESAAALQQEEAPCLLIGPLHMLPGEGQQIGTELSCKLAERIMFN
jgi:hypothetical protein